MSINVLNDIAKHLSAPDLEMLTTFARRLHRSGKRGAGYAKGNSKQDVQTPPEFMAAVTKRFGSIAVDLAANETNNQAEFWLGPGGAYPDSLQFKWDSPSLPPGNKWLNPPFDPILPWATRCAWYSATSSDPILFLTPASTGANWFLDYVLPFAHVLSVGRIKFVGHKTPYPKDLVLSVFGLGNAGKLESWRGWAK